MIPLVLLLAQFFFGELRLVTEDTLPAGVFRLSKPAGAHSEAAFRAYSDELKSILDDHGYWYAALSMERVEVDSASMKIHIDLRIRLNDPVRIGFIRFEGAHPLPSELLLRRMRFEPGRIATRQELERIRQRLLVMEDVAHVSDPVLITEEGHDGVLIPIRPVSGSRSDVLIGYADKEVVGQVTLNLRHLLRPGSRFDLRFHRLGSVKNRLDVDVAAGVASASFRLYQQDSTFFTRAWAVGADVPVGRDLLIGAWLERHTTITGVVGAIEPIEAGTRQLTGLRFRWQPEPAQRLDVRSGIGSRNRMAVRTAAADWNFGFRPTSTVRPVWSGSAAAMISERIPIDNLYRFGGATSFRGVREEELQASKYIWNELELRIASDDDTYVFGFIGHAWLPSSDLLFNGGVGFSTPTRLGPLRFTYAGHSQRGWLQGVVHVSLSSGL